MKFAERLNRIIDRILAVAAVGGAALIIFIMFAVDTQVVMRSGFHAGIMWIVEVAAYTLLYITFLGTAWLLQNDGHVKMDLLLNKMRPRSQAAVNIFTSFLGIVISAFLVWFGSTVTLEHFQQGYYLKTVVEPPTWPLIIVIPFGSFLLLLQFIRKTWGHVQEFRTGNEIRQKQGGAFRFE